MMDDVAAHTTAPFVGRDAELDELVSWLGGDLDEGDGPPHGTTVLLSGDAGVGKTRLLTEVRDRLAADGWRVVAGHCLDLGDSALPYLPFSEILGRLATDLPEVVATVAGRHPTLARLLPGRRTLAGEAGDGAADRPFRALRGRPRPARRGCRRGAAARRRRGQPTGPTSPPATCSPSSSRVTPPRPSRSSSAIAPTTSTAATRSVATSPSGHGSSGVRRLALAPLSDDSVHQLIAELVPGGLSMRRDRRHRRPRRGQRVLRRGAHQRRRRAGPVGAGRARRRAAGPPRSARRPGPPGGACGERRRSQGLPRAPRRRLRPHRRRARRGIAPGRRDERAGSRRRPLRVPPRPARRGGLRRPAAGRTGAAPRRLRHRAARGWRDRHRRRARPPLPAGPRPRDRAPRQHPRRPRRARGRRSRRGRPPLRAGARSCSPTHAGPRRDRRRPVGAGRPPRRRADRARAGPTAR